MVDFYIRVSSLVFLLDGFDMNRNDQCLLL